METHRIEVTANKPGEFVAYCEPCRAVQQVKIECDVQVDQAPVDIDTVEGVVSCLCCKSILGNLVQLQRRRQVRDQLK